MHSFSTFNLLVLLCRVRGDKERKTSLCFTWWVWWIIYICNFKAYFKHYIRKENKFMPFLLKSQDIHKWLSYYFWIMASYLTCLKYNLRQVQSTRFRIQPWLDSCRKIELKFKFLEFKCDLNLRQDLNCFLKRRNVECSSSLLLLYFTERVTLLFCVKLCQTCVSFNIQLIFRHFHLLPSERHTVTPCHISIFHFLLVI